MADMNLTLTIRAVNQATAPIRQLAADLRSIGGVAKLIPLSMLGVGLAAVGVAGDVALMARAIGASVIEAQKLGLVLGAAGAAGVFAFKKSFVDIASEAEKFRLRMENLEGSWGRGEAAMAWTAEFKKRTAATLADVREAYMELRERGINPTTGALQRVADAAAQKDRSIESVAKVVTAAAEGKFKGLEKLDIDAKKVGNSVVLSYEHLGQRFTRVVGNAKDQTAVVQAVLEIFNTKFAGQAAKLAGTWEGLWSNLAQDWKDFALDVMNDGVFEVLKESIRDLRSWVAGLKQTGELKAFAQETAQFFREVIGSVVEATKWARTELPGVVREIKGVVDALGGWKVVGAGVAAFFAAPFVASLLTVGLSIINLAKTITTVMMPALAAFGAATGGTVLASVVALGKAMGSTLLVGLSAAVVGIKTLSLVLLTTPVGWIILAIGAIAAAAYLIYDNWDWVQQQVRPILDTLGRWWEESADWVRRAWSGVREFFAGLWSGIEQAFDGAIGRIRATIGSLIQWFDDKLGGIRRLLGLTRGDVDQVGADAGRATGANAGAAIGVRPLGSGAGGRPQQVEVDNRLHIKIDAEGRPSVTEVRAGRGGSVDVDLGYSMVMP